MRQPEPRWRKDRKAWICYIDGKMVTLAKGRENKQAAWTELRRILADGKKLERLKGDNVLFVHLADDFLEYVKREKSQGTYDWYQYMLQGFCSFKKSKKARELTPQDIEEWFTKGKQKFSAGTRSRAIDAISRVLNWAVRQKILKENPLKGMERPRKPRREVFVNAEQRATILGEYSDGDPFRDFLFAMEQSGCRPGEIRKLTSDDVSLQHGLWIITKHKTKNQTGKNRIVYLSTPLLELTNRLMAKVPAGTPIFRNTDGEPWTKNAIRLRFSRVRKRLKMPGLVAYLFRHGFATQALERGLSDAVVAALLGHADTRVIHSTYSHLTSNAKLLREAADKAVQ